MTAEAEDAMEAHGVGIQEAHNISRGGY